MLPPTTMQPRAPRKVALHTGPTTPMPTAGPSTSSTLDTDTATTRDGAPGEPGCGTACCNFMCTGGCAILVAAAVMEPPLPAAPATELAALINRAEPSGLERPPKVSLPA